MKTHKKRAAMPALATGNLVRAHILRAVGQAKDGAMMSMQRPVNRRVSIFWRYDVIPASGGISPRSSPYRSKASQGATPSSRDSTSSESSTLARAGPCPHMPPRCLSRAGFERRCTNRMVRSSVARGNSGWRWPCVMALRSGDIYLPERRRHVSFSNLVYDPTRWTHERDLASTDPPAPLGARRLCRASPA
jgi:hypothetical protein